MASYLTATIDTNRRKYPDTESTLTVNVYSADVLANPATITGKWRVGADGTETSLVLVNGGTGIYTAPIKPEDSGFIHYRLVATTPDVSLEGTYLLEPTHFDNVTTKDYSG